MRLFKWIDKPLKAFTLIGIGLLVPGTIAGGMVGGSLGMLIGQSIVYALALNINPH